MGLTGDAAQYIDSINRIASGPDARRDSSKASTVYGKLRSGHRIGDGDIWRGLTPEAQQLLGLDFVEGAIRRAVQRETIIGQDASDLLRALLGSLVEPGVNEAMVRYRIGPANAAVRAARLSAELQKADTPTERLDAVVRCAAATGAVLSVTEHRAEHLGDAWQSLDAAAEQVDLGAAVAALHRHAFGVRTGIDDKAISLALDTDRPDVGMVSITTPLLRASRPVPLEQWRGGPAHRANQTVCMRVMDYFSVQLDEFTGFMLPFQVLAEGPLNAELSELIGMALSAQELVTPVATIVSVRQEVAKL